MDTDDLFALIDEELALLDSIALRGTISYQMILTAKTALKELRVRIEERLDEIPK